MTEQPGSQTHSSPNHPDTADPPLDTVALLEQCMGNAALVTMLFDKFETQAREDLVRIEQALGAQDAGQITRVSHALKGAAGALSATQVQRTAALIEHAAREGRLEAASACFNDLKSQVDRCLAYLPTARTAAKGAAPIPKP